VYLKIGNWREEIHLPEGGKSLLKFAGVELSVSVEVHAFEDDFESTESNTSLLLDSKLESEIELTDHNVLVHTVEGHRKSK